MMFYMSTLTITIACQSLTTNLILCSNSKRHLDALFLGKSVKSDVKYRKYRI